MSFNTVPGKLYIIGEEDVFGSLSSPYFKVGIVKEEREVEKRLSEHQTGNPRKLVIRDLIEVAAVEYLETHLHHRLATKVAFSEWFKLSETEYAELLQLARKLSDEVALQVPLAQLASQFKDSVSNGLIVPATSELWQLHSELYPETVKVKKVSKVISEVNAVVRTRATTSDQPVVGQRKIEVSKEVFNLTKFQEENPEIVASFQKESISGLLTIKKIADVDSEFSGFDPLKTYLDLSKEDLDRISETELEQARRQLTEIEAVSEWSKNHHDVAVRSAIGENDGIENVATWKRSVKARFDKSAFRKAEPELYAQYVEYRTEERWIDNNQGIEVSGDDEPVEEI